MAAGRGPAGCGEEAVAGREPYASESDLADALEVATPTLTLMGYPGSGEGTLPHTIAQVRHRQGKSAESRRLGNYFTEDVEIRAVQGKAQRQVVRSRCSEVA
eukprot:5341656-Pleurochrysis_carterae.AAC.1